jgi:hypothetical protein
VSAIAQALQEKDRPGGITLKAREVLASMPPETRELAEQLLASHRSDRAVSDAFTQDGYPLSQNAVRNYRVVNRLHRFAS